jgi:hypothetical protein
MASTAFEQTTDEQLQRMDEILAGPHKVKLEELFFRIPCSALDALKALDQRFGKTTAEIKTPEIEFRVWRILKVDGMELRFHFYTDATDLEWNNVSVFGFKTKDAVDESCFSAYDCYARLLDGVALSQQHASAVAMGQHARLGRQSLLSLLPEALFHGLLQPRISTLEPWDGDQEDALQAVIKQQEFEETKVLLDELVASSGTTGELFFDCIRDIRAACVVLDQRFGVDTPEEYSRETFVADRRLTINGRTVQFAFIYDRRFGPIHVHVHGLGEVEGLSSEDTDYISPQDLDGEAFVYFLDALLAPTRYYEARRYEITTE